MRESDIEDYLIKCVAERGGETRKLKYIGRKDAPDRLVLLPHFTSLVELKATGVKPSRSQLKEHVLLRAAGLDVRVIDSFLGAERLIEEATRHAQ